MEMDSKYHVGDRVRIVNNTFRPGDTFAIDTKQEVRAVQWCDMCGRYEYYIQKSGLLWCDDDFEFDLGIELPEFSVSEVSLSDLFSE